MFVACRSHERALAALASIASPDGTPPPEALVLDLGDFDSVQRCATAFLARDLPLHILVNNAGIAGARGLSASGFELAFGVNHMGHFLLTRLLLQRILKYWDIGKHKAALVLNAVFVNPGAEGNAEDL